MKDWQILTLAMACFIIAVVLDRYNETQRNERIANIVERMMKE